jgi:hypothetical protein
MSKSTSRNGRRAQKQAKLRVVSSSAKQAGWHFAIKYKTKHASASSFNRCVARSLVCCKNSTAAATRFLVDTYYNEVFMLK